MIKKYSEFLKKHLKQSKNIAVLGIAGILLIGFSSFFGGKQKDETAPISDYGIDSEEYRLAVQEQIRQTVISITGDKNASVVVTLETGVRYTYASETEENKNDTVDEKKSGTVTEVKKNYIKVKTASGGEEALLITQYMPQIRGVAIVCSGVEEPAVADNIKNAVTSALGITSKKVCVAQRSENKSQ